MKSKLLAIIAAVTLMTGCQTGEIEDVPPQQEVQIDEAKDSTSPSESNIDQDGEKQIEMQNDNERSEETMDETDIQSGSASGEKEALSPADNGYEVAALPPEDVVVDTMPERLKAIEEETLQQGILEACSVFLEMGKSLNSSELETVQFEDIYETYWRQEAPLDSLDRVKSNLAPYYTEKCIADMISLWGLIEYDNHVFAPERTKLFDLDMNQVDVLTSDVPDDAGARYVNFNFTTKDGTQKSSLMLLKKAEEGRWKIDTIPGTGIVERYENSFIRDAYWRTGRITWNWPDFISSQDQVWNDVLTGVQTEIQEDIESKTIDFVPSEAFSKIGASQLSYWVDWVYSKENKVYPHLHITVSEYMKYGIHPNHTRQTVTIDGSSGQRIMLEDLYSDEVAFKERVNVFIDVYMSDHSDAFYDGAVFEGIDDRTQFYLTESGIAFYFQLYEYAPYAFGYPVIEVPFSVLEGTLAPEIEKLDMTIDDSQEADEGGL